MYISNLQVTPAMWGNSVWHEKLMKGIWEAETSIENGAAVDPLIISLEETSKEKMVQLTGQLHLNKWR
jgi:hypothetical protein